MLKKLKLMLNITFFFLFLIEWEFIFMIQQKQDYKHWFVQNFNPNPPKKKTKPKNKKLTQNHIKSNFFFSKFAFMILPLFFRKRSYFMLSVLHLRYLGIKIYERLKSVVWANRSKISTNYTRLMKFLKIDFK